MLPRVYVRTTRNCKRLQASSTEAVFSPRDYYDYGSSPVSSTGGETIDEKIMRPAFRRPHRCEVLVRGQLHVEYMIFDVKLEWNCNFKYINACIISRGTYM